MGITPENGPPHTAEGIIIEKGQPMYYRPSSLLLVIALLTTVHGCVTYKSAPIDVRQIETYAYRVVTGGVSVAADPYDTSAKAKEGFHIDVTEEGFYPVNLIFKNDNDCRVLVLRKKIELIDATGNSHSTVRSTAMFQTFEKNEKTYALLGFGTFSYVSADEANRAMATDWREKEMPDQLIILPERKTSGFVYFKLPKERRMKGDKIRLEVENIDSKEKLQFELTL